MVLKDELDNILSGKKFEMKDVKDEDWANALAALGELEEIQNKAKKILMQLLLISESTQRYCHTKGNQMVLAMKSGEEIEFCCCSLNLFYTVFDLSLANKDPGLRRIIERMANLADIKLLIMIDKEGLRREGRQIALKDIKSIKTKL